MPERPMIFMKPSTTLCHPDDPVFLPALEHGDKLDYEGELVIVIGKRGRNIKAEDALEHVFGWTVANDVSARHWQRQAGGNQIIIGKGFDTHCPLGPVLVTTEEILTLTGSGP